VAIAARGPVTRLRKDAGQSVLDRLDRLSRDLAGEVGELAALVGHGLVLLAEVGGRELERLRVGPCACEIADQIDGRIAVGAGGVHHLSAVAQRAIGADLVGADQQVGRIALSCTYLKYPMSHPGIYSFFAGAGMNLLQCTMTHRPTPGANLWR
jgi:hypothetical protein